MRPHSPPPPTYAFGYLTPPESGNAINGLGEATPTRATGVPQQEKQLVRGKRKWYVDFDKCIPYFVKTYGCAICIEVCPWSEPGKGPALSARVLERRRARAGGV